MAEPQEDFQDTQISEQPIGIEDGPKFHDQQQEFENTSAAQFALLETTSGKTPDNLAMGSKSNYFKSDVAVSAGNIPEDGEESDSSSSLGSASLGSERSSKGSSTTSYSTSDKPFIHEYLVNVIRQDA
jgi:hypothetical protein